MLDGVIGSYPQPHMVLQHSVLDTSESRLAFSLSFGKKKGSFGKKKRVFIPE